MPVNFTLPQADQLLPVPGVRLGVAQARIRKPNRDDLLVIDCDEGTVMAGVFTLNRFCAAPVHLCRAHLAAGAPRALVVNTGNANAGTGEDGMARARRTCAALAELLGCEPARVLPFSTGVIMEPLPVDRIEARLPDCVARLGQDDWLRAASAIMTTDTVPKAASRRLVLDGAEVTLTGIAKGSGMIHPNMATMLSFIATDANINAELLQDVLQGAVAQSFNSITVDGDTSTNDSCVLLASRQAAMPPIARGSSAHAAFRDAVADLMVELAQMIVRDGEGATKFIEINVSGGRSLAECRQIAFAVAHSPLVKTAFFASDPNLGRILAAIGYAGVADLDVDAIRVSLDDVVIAEQGGRAAGYREEDGARVMEKAEIAINIALGRGDAAATVWTCDLSHDYVRINAEYRS